MPALGRHQVLPVILLGLTGVFSYNILFFNGLKHVDAGRASLIIANNPIVISLFSALLFKERLTGIKTVGICLSVAGAMTVISHGRMGDWSSYHMGVGEWMIMGCVASWVAYSLIGKTVMAGLSPLVSVTYSAFVGTLLLCGPAVYYGLGTTMFTYRAWDWLNLAYLGIFGTTIGFSWYYQGIQHIGPMKASVFINFVPISAILLAYFILHEQITWSIGLGAAMVVSGVYMTNASEYIKQYAKIIYLRRRP